MIADVNRLVSGPAAFDIAGCWSGKPAEQLNPGHQAAARQDPTSRFPFFLRNCKVLFFASEPMPRNCGGLFFWTAENLFAGIFVGLAICAVWWVSGNLGYVAEDPNTLAEVFLVTNSGRMESLSFVAPYAYSLDWLMMYSDTSKVITVGIAAVIGMILGSACVSIFTKSFRWESFRNTEDTANHLIGATLMGFGGVTALGCTVGQGLSGISTLAIGSILALPGFIFGAYLALRYLESRNAPNPCS